MLLVSWAVVDTVCGLLYGILQYSVAIIGSIKNIKENEIML
jgi:hypothetical protein